jgi:hypothetical protein
MTRLRRLGIAAALEERGVQPGDRVRLRDVELRWLLPFDEPPPRRSAAERKASARRRR